MSTVFGVSLVFLFRVWYTGYMTQLAHNGIMKREETQPDEKRLTLRLAAELWRELRMEAARRDTSTTGVINMLLKERLEQLRGERGQ